MRVLPLLLPLALIACGRPPVIPPLPQGPPLTPDEIAARYIDEPSTLPPESSAPLGLSGDVRGRLPNWRGTRQTPLYRSETTAGPGQEVGHILVDGTFTAALPGSEPRPLAVLDFVRSRFDLSNERCFLDTLSVDPPNAMLGVFRATTPNTIVPSPGMPGPAIPPPPFVQALPYFPSPTEAGEVTLVFVSSEVTVRGERRCLPRVVPYRTITTKQVNLSVHVRLAQGWNVVRSGVRHERIGMTSVERVSVEAAPDDIVPSGR